MFKLSKMFWKKQNFQDCLRWMSKTFLMLEAKIDGEYPGVALASEFSVLRLKQKIS